MLSLVLAAETAELVSTTPPGDEYMTAALVMAGIAFIVTAAATWRITPKASHHYETPTFVRRSVVLVVPIK